MPDQPSCFSVSQVAKGQEMVPLASECVPAPAGPARSAPGLSAQGSGLGSGAGWGELRVWQKPCVFPHQGAVYVAIAFWGALGSRQVGRALLWS